MLNHRPIKLIVALSGVLVFIISALAALDKVLGVSFFSHWGGSSTMAVPTIVSFLVVGSALILLGKPDER